MLSLVHGPVPLVDRQTGDPVEFLTRPQWVDGLGLCGHGDAANYYFIAKLDGVCLRRRGEALGVSDAYHLNLETRSSTGVRGHQNVFNRSYGFDPITGRRGTYYGHADRRDAGLPGRTVRMHDGVIYRHADFDAVENPESVEAVLANHADGNAGFWSLGPHSDEVVIVDEGGYIYHYDHINKKLAAPVTGVGMATRGGWYSREFGVYITLHAHAAGQEALRAWAPDVVPATISDPTSTFAAGRLVEVTTAVLGSYGEPVADMPVQWTLTGDGDLLDGVSRTDANGVARTQYIAPVGGDSAANIAAEVVV